MPEKIYTVTVKEYTESGIWSGPVQDALAASLILALTAGPPVMPPPTTPTPPPPPPPGTPMRTKADFDALEAVYGFPCDPTDIEAYYDGELTWEQIVAEMKRRAAPTDPTP